MLRRAATYPLEIAKRLRCRNPRLIAVALAAWATFCSPHRVFSADADTASKPNVIIILADDLGYGDLACYGQENYTTPRLNKMAEEGARLNRFSTNCPFCAPTRVGLQTGRYQFRSGLVNNPAPDAGPEADGLGIPDKEITLGELFKGAGYYTACVGKWHLGHKPQFRPLRHGYNEYFGILYSNDMYPVHLYDGDLLVKSLVIQTTLTQLYTERALSIISDHKDQPFFLYLAHAMPHKPLAPSRPFVGRGGGLYGDTMVELDSSVGAILDKLAELELDEKTLVIFTSDNGPWYGGSTGGLRGMKAQTWEGGTRVPFIARWPGKIPAGHTSNEIAVMPDVFTTVLTVAGIKLPSDRPIDGLDLMPILTSDAKSPHEAIYCIKGNELCSVTSGRWKLHGPRSGPRTYKRMPLSEPYRDPRGPDGVRILAPYNQYHPSQLPGIITGDSEGEWMLFDLLDDPTEQKNIAEKRPDEVARLRVLFDKLLAEMPESMQKASLKPLVEKKADDKKSDDKKDDKKDTAKKPEEKKPDEKK